MPAKSLAIWIVFFLGGALLAPFFELSPNLWFILGGTLCLSSFFLFRKRYLWTLLFALGVLFLSITGFQAQKLEYKTLNLEHAEKQGKFVGSVSTMPTDTETGKKVTLGNISIDGVKTKGSVVIYTRKYPEAEFADQLQFAGKIKKYNQRENSLIKDNLIGEITVNEFQKVGKDKTFVYRAKGILFGIRGKFNEALQKSLPQKEANLASGLILGEKSLLSADQKRALQNSGTSHIVALSGYNITIILSLFVVAQGRLSRRWNLLLPLLFIFLFVVMTGASASVVRAGIMGFMPVLARYLGRSTNSLLAVLVSAFVMALVNPFIVLYDVGFQLSFTALCGVLYLAPLLSNLFKWLPDTVRLILSETLGAQMAVLPLLLFYFGSVSIISPVSNLLVLSLIPAGMLAAFVVGLVGILVPSIVQIFAIPGYVLLHLIYAIIEYFGSLPFALAQARIENPIWLLFAYAIIIDIIFMSWKRINKIKQDGKFI